MLFLDLKQLLVIIMFENLFYDLLKVFIVHITFDVYKQLKGIKRFLIFLAITLIFLIVMD